MPITKRPEGAYQVSVGVGGRKMRRSSRHWTFAQARQVEQDLYRQLRAADAGTVQGHTLSEALEKWMREHVPRLRSAKESRSKARMLFPHIAGRRIEDAPQVWSEIKAELADKAPATVNHRGRLLRRLCNLAHQEWGWTPEPLGKRIRLLPETPRETFLTSRQVEALAKAAGGDAGRLIRVAAYTGIRHGHLLRLTAEDVRGGFIALDRSGKTQRRQMIPVHPRIAKTVKQLPLPVSEWDLRVAWTRARKECGLEHVRWHDLRHTCASWLVQAGVDITTVRDLLGHSSTAVTNRYAHLAAEHLRQAISKLA
jgi:integrase